MKGRIALSRQSIRNNDEFTNCRGSLRYNRMILRTWASSYNIIAEAQTFEARDRRQTIRRICWWQTRQNSAEQVWRALRPGVSRIFHRRVVCPLCGEKSRQFHMTASFQRSTNICPHHFLQCRSSPYLQPYSLQDDRTPTNLSFLFIDAT